MSRLRGKKGEMGTLNPPRQARFLNREVTTDILLIAAISMMGYWIRLDRLNGYSSEDDAAYVAACGLIMKGYVPHRDFFLAHPSGFFYFVTLLWRLLRLENPQTMWFVGKLVSFFSFVATGAVIYLICRKILNNRTAGLIGIAIYQLSSQTSLFSVACAPQLPATFLMIASVYILLDDPLKTWKKTLILGLSLGTALVTRLSTLYPLPLFLLYIILVERRRPTEWRKLATVLVLLVLPLLVMLATAPIGNLWFDLVAFHFLKGSSTIAEKIGKLLSILTSRELPHLLGLISTPYALSKRDTRLNFLIGQGILLLGPYFMQATPGAHLLIESAPFFTILTAVATAQTANSILERRRPLLAVCSSILLLTAMALSLPPAVTEVSRVLHETTLEGRVYRRLVDIVDRETSKDDVVFSQIPLVPFLAGRNYPPFIDTSQSAKSAGIYTPEVVAEIVLRYRVKLLIVWYRTGDDLSDFLLGEGFTKLENLGGYTIYIRSER